MKNYKFLCLACAFFFCLDNMSAQFEFKADLISLIYHSADLSAEYIVSDKVSIGSTLGINFGKNINSSLLDDSQSGYRLRLQTKYFFNPKVGADRWYAGLYAGSKSRTERFTDKQSFSEIERIESSIPAGFSFGFKYVGEPSFVLDINGGIGREFNNIHTRNGEVYEPFLDIFGEYDAFFNILLGYRF